MTLFVLIHAAATDSWYWGPLVTELSRLGHQAVAVDLPCEDDGKDLTDYADTVVGAVRAAGTADASVPRPGTVVVGHSFGGFTAPLVADRLGADLLVMLQAQIPIPGEAPGDWWENTGHAQARRQQDAKDGRTEEMAVDPVELMLHDTPRELAEQALGRQRDQSATPFSTHWPLPAWPEVSTRVLLSSGDRFFPLDFMRRVARERLGLEPDVMPGDHCPMLSHPGELAARLVAYLP